MISMSNSPGSACAALRAAHAVELVGGLVAALVVQLVEQHLRVVGHHAL
jgi:hypothetical protein